MKVKRWLAVLLCVAQVLALLTVPAFADEGGGPGGPTVATMPSGVTTVSVTAEETKLETAAWQTNGYAYVAFTAAKNGTYTIFAKGTENSSEDIQICVDASPQTGNGAGYDADAGLYEKHLTFNANAGGMYVFQIPKFGSSDVYVYVVEGAPGPGGPGGSGNEGGPVGPTAATMPSGVTPVSVTAEETKLETAAWQTNGYAYVAFTAAKNGTYTIFAKGIENSSEDIQICVDASPQTGSGSGSGEENGALQYHRTLTFNATESETYTFQIPKFGSSDVTVYVIEGAAGGGGTGPGGQFTPTADNIYVGGNSPEGIQYVKELTGTGSYVQGYYLSYYDGTDYTVLGAEDVTVVYEVGNDIDGYTTDNGSIVTISSGENDSWTFEFQRATTGRLGVSYHGNTYYIPVRIFGIPGPDSTDPVTTVPADGSAIALDNNTMWIDRMGKYTYLSFTPSADGTYTIRAEATRTDTGMINSGMELCGDDFSVTERQGSEATDSSWLAYGVYSMKAGTTYYIKLNAEPDRLNDITVTGKPYDASNENPGPGPAYNVPDPQWPIAGSEAEDKILDADKDQTVDVRDNLVSLSDDWYVVYVTFTPEETAVYRLMVEIEDGVKTEAGAWMAQTFRCRQDAMWSNGGYQYGMDNDIQMADYYKMEKGQTYQFQVLLCKHGVDWDKPFNFILEKHDCPLRTENIFASSGNKAIANVQGFFGEGGSDASVTGDSDTGVVIDATLDDDDITGSVVSVEKSSVATMSGSDVSSVTILTNVADVTFSEETIDQMAESKDAVTFTVDKESDTSGTTTLDLGLTDTQGNALIPESSADDNGTVTVATEYGEVAEGCTVQVEYVDGNSAKTVENVQYDADTGVVSFETNHFSTYRITTKTASCNGNHTFTNYKVMKKATCTQDGEKVAICDVCMNAKDTQKIPATDHSWDSGKVTTKATCTKDGVMTYRCDCGETKTGKIPAIGHHYEKSICTQCGILKTDCDGGKDCPVHSYTDVEFASWYHKDGYLDYAVSNGIMVGVTPKTFVPEAEMTRAQMIQALWNLAGQPKVDYKPKFEDIEKEAWYYPALAWAAEKGLAEGMPNGTFAPNEAITRDQMVTFLYRYAKLIDGRDVTALEIPEKFSDRNQVMPYAKEAFAWAIDRGIVNGMGTTPETLAPQETAKRSQLAKILTIYDIMD